MWLHDNQICHVSLTEETAIFNAKDASWVVTHQFHHALNGQNAFIHQFQHRHEGELHKGHTTCGFSRSARFIGDAVRSVVCADGADASIGERSANGFAVSGIFDRRVAFDARSETFVVFARKHQVRKARLSRDLFVVRVEKIKFRSRGDVRHVEFYIKFTSQCDGFFRAFHTSLSRTNFRMIAHMRILAVFLFVFFHLRYNHRRIFAVHHNGKFALLEDGAECGFVFHLQFAGAAAHKEFDAGH